MTGKYALFLVQGVGVLKPTPVLAPDQQEAEKLYKHHSGVSEVASTTEVCRMWNVYGVMQLAEEFKS